jgi:GNAT superfamily N-acetyltransferase
MPGPLPTGIEISTDPTRLDLNVIHAFIRESYWSPGIPREVVERAIRGSLCFGAHDGGRLVGFARVVSDRATFAWVCDVFVVESHRQRGIADALMSSVMAHPELQGLRRWSLATRDAHPLYRRHGFQPVDDPSRMMEIRRPDIYQRAATDPAVGEEALPQGRSQR